MRKLRNRNPEKLICIKIINPKGPPHMYDRVTRTRAHELMMKHDNVHFTSKSAYHRFLQKEVMR